MSDFEIALVGCGNAGQNRHMPAIRAHPETDLVALCDLDEERLRAAGEGVDANLYTDLETLLSKEDLDAVHVSTPPQTHLDVAETTLTAGVPTLIEKPVATSTEEVTEMISIREETGTPVTVVHNRLFLPFVREALRRVERGDVGEVVAVTMLFSNSDDLTESPRGDWVFDLPGGEFGEGSPHQVYLPLAFVDGLGEIGNVTSQNFAGYEPPIELDGASVSAVDGSGDRLVTIEMLTHSAVRDTLFVHGTEAELQIDMVKRGLVVNDTHSRYSADAVLFDSLGAAGQLTRNVFGNGIGFLKRVLFRKLGDPRSEAANGHYVQMDRFIEAVRTGSPPPVTLEEGHETMEVLEALD